MIGILFSSHKKEKHLKVPRSPLKVKLLYFHGGFKTRMKYNAGIIISGPVQNHCSRRP